MGARRDSEPELTEQYVVSGKDFTMTFLLLAIQSGVCVLAVWSVKKLGVITCEPTQPSRLFSAAEQ